MTWHSFTQPEYLGQGVLRAGSIVESGTNLMSVIYNRNDLSSHGNSGPHDNFDIAVSISGGKLKGVELEYYSGLHLFEY